jgi:predicted esterase
MAPLAENEPDLGAALRAYADAVDGLIGDGFAADRIVVGGFSQGACLTAELLVRLPRRYGGAIVWTGGLIGPPGTAWPSPPALRGMPVLLTGSLIDEWVPAERVRTTEAVLRAAGAAPEVEIFADRPHEVSEPELAAARRLLAGLVRGARAAA